jgi:hypothetical protein
MGVPARARTLGPTQPDVCRRSIRDCARSLAAVERDAEKIVAEPLAGQLRAFAGLFNARYAFIPVELRLAPDAGGGARATIHAVVIDTRAAKLTWKGDVIGDAVRTFSPAVAAGIAGRVADLFTAPAR